MTKRGLEILKNKQQSAYTAYLSGDDGSDQGISENKHNKISDRNKYILNKIKII